MKTIVYVDGFNLYYGAVKGTPYKWLDLSRLCQLLLPTYSIEKIKYFTAQVGGRPPDYNQPVRQQVYLRALRTIPNLEIIEGRFLSHPCSMPLANQAPNQPPQIVRVIRTEEKGSDVNIAAHLINDGYKGEYEAAVLVTNDSDLAEPVRIVAQELKLPIGIANPHKHPSLTLVQHATFKRKIRAGVLQASQFPNALSDAAGSFTKPSQW